MKKSSIIIGVVVAAIVIVAAVLLLGNKPAAGPADSSGSSTAAPTNTTPAAATITYSSSGFSPATVTVKTGDTIAIKNTSNQTMQFDSDPHPVHTDDTDLNAGVVDPGQTKTFIVTQKGSFGYHNHLNPSDMGKIIIE